MKRATSLVALLVLCFVAGCEGEQKGNPPGRGAPVTFHRPGDGWVLTPAQPKEGTDGPSNETGGDGKTPTGWVHIGHDKKDGDPSSTASKKVKCEGEGDYCTVVFGVTFKGPKDSKDKLKLTYWGADGTKKTVYLKDAPVEGAGVTKEYKLSVKGACDELNLEFSIETADAAAKSSAAIKISNAPAPACTKDDQSDGFVS